MLPTAATSESVVIDQKAPEILHTLRPETVTADDGYTKALRIRNWAKQGVCLITPALRWVKGRYAKAYHQFLRQENIKQLSVKRKTSVEPLFDLIAKVIGATDNHKQIKIQRIVNVQTCLAMGTLAVQIAMIMNSL